MKIENIKDAKGIISKIENLQAEIQELESETYSHWMYPDDLMKKHREEKKQWCIDQQGLFVQELKNL